VLKELDLITVELRNLPPEGRVTLAPHNPDRTSFQYVEVHGIQSSLS